MRPGCLNIRGQEEELGEEIWARDGARVWDTEGRSIPQHHVLLKRRPARMVCAGEKGREWS